MSVLSVAEPSISAQRDSDAWGNVEKTGDPFGTTYCLNRSKHDEISSALGIRELSQNRFERQLPTSLGRHVVCGNRTPTKNSLQETLFAGPDIRSFVGPRWQTASVSSQKKRRPRCRTLEVIHVDEVCPLCKALLKKLRLTDPVRCDCGWEWQSVPFWDDPVTPQSQPA